MSTTVSSTIDVDATPLAVWEVFGDFAAYGQWHPFMPSIEGVPETGARLAVRLTPPRGGRGTTFRPTVLVAETADRPDRRAELVAAARRLLETAGAGAITLRRLGASYAAAPA